MSSAPPLDPPQYDGEKELPPSYSCLEQSLAEQQSTATAPTAPTAPTATQAATTHHPQQQQQQQAKPKPVTTTTTTNANQLDILEREVRSEESTIKQFRYINVLFDDDASKANTPVDPFKSKYFNPVVVLVLSTGLVLAWFFWIFKLIAQLLKITHKGTPHSSAVNITTLCNVFNKKHGIAPLQQKDEAYHELVVQKEVCNLYTVGAKNKAIKLGPDDIPQSPANILYTWRRDENKYYNYCCGAVGLLLFPLYFYVYHSTLHDLTTTKRHIFYRFFFIATVVNVLFIMTIVLQYLYKNKYHHDPTLSPEAMKAEKKARMLRYTTWVLGFPIGLAAVFIVLLLICWGLEKIFGAFEVSVVCLFIAVALLSKPPQRKKEYSYFVEEVKKVMVADYNKQK